jgi:hypothetical protein
MLLWAYVGSLVALALGLPIFSYLTLIYRELGRMSTGRVHEHLEIFEAEIEPKLNINRRSGGRTFRILGHFWLAFVVLETTRGIVTWVPNFWEAGVQFLVFLSDALHSGHVVVPDDRPLACAPSTFDSCGYVAGMADSRVSRGSGITGAHFRAGGGAHRRATHRRRN